MRHQYAASCLCTAGRPDVLHAGHAEYSRSHFRGLMVSFLPETAVAFGLASILGHASGSAPRFRWPAHIARNGIRTPLASAAVKLLLPSIRSIAHRRRCSVCKFDFGVGSPAGRDCTA